MNRSAQHSSLLFRALLPACVLSLLFTGCAGALLGGDRARGSLSDAMDQAAEEDPEDRRVKADDDDEVIDLSVLLVSDSTNMKNDSTAKGETDDSLGSKIYHPGSFTISLQQGVVANQAFTGLTSGGFELNAWLDEQVRVDLELELRHSPIQQSDPLSHSIQGGIVLFYAGFDLNRFVTPYYTFMGAWYSFGLGYSVMFWKFQNPLIVETGSGDDEITWDFLEGLDLHAGVGWNLMQTSRLRLGAELVPGVVFWHDETGEGFTNDVFDPMLYVNLKVTFRFTLGSGG